MIMTPFLSNNLRKHCKTLNNLVGFYRKVFAHSIKQVMLSTAAADEMLEGKETGDLNLARKCMPLKKCKHLCMLIKICLPVLKF